ncbi:Phage portal protein, SPP1 Gp6-like [anaerobic digester metagenome]
MSVVSALMNNKIQNFEEAFNVKDITSSDMKCAIKDWYWLYYNREQTETEDPCQRLAYTVVNKLNKTVFSEYEAKSSNAFAASVLMSLDRRKYQAMQQASIGGEGFLKPIFVNSRIEFSMIPRRNYIVLGRNELDAITDIGTQESTEVDKLYYTLLERRTIGYDGRLTIQNRLFRSDTKDIIGTEVSLTALDKYAELQPSMTLSTPLYSLGLIPIKTPMENCVDGSEDGVSVYAAASGLIHQINVNEKQLSGEFERGESRIIVSNDLMKKDPTTGRRMFKDHIFTGLDDDPETTGVTIFSPELRHESFLARKQEYLRNIESMIGLKRGILSEVEETEKTATEITSSAGDYNLTVQDFQRMWENTVKEALRVCSILGPMYHISGATVINPEKDVTIEWGDGVLFDRTRTWQEYTGMVASGLLKPELALAWYFDLPTPKTPADFEKIRADYMPDMQKLAKDGGGGDE